MIGVVLAKNEFISPPGGKWQLAITRIVTTLGLMGPYVVLCHFKKFHHGHPNRTHV